MSVIGKSVYHVCDVSNLKFGTVIAEKVINKWRWLRVDWKNGIQAEENGAPTKVIENEEFWKEINNLYLFKKVD